MVKNPEYCLDADNTFNNNDIHGNNLFNTGNIGNFEPEFYVYRFCFTSVNSAACFANGIPYGRFFGYDKEIKEES